MRVNLNFQLEGGINNLLAWRNRYSITEYPEKVVLNLFYRKYTIEFMFEEILDCFGTTFFGKPKIKFHDFNEGFNSLKLIYDKTRVEKTRPVLNALIGDRTRFVGSANSEAYHELISAVNRSDHKKLEEIEFSYLYYLLTDECILYWGALGGTGMTKYEAIEKLSSFKILNQTPIIDSYLIIEEYLGRFCSAPFLKDNYKPLPPNV